MLFGKFDRSTGFQPVRHGLKTRATLLLAALICIPAAIAQLNNPASLFARDSTEGVYVRDSAVAAEKMALAYRLEHLKEWNKAADVYQELLQSYADRVTPSDDRDQRIYQYTSVAIAVQQKLAKWPTEGIEAYRARFETEAASLLQQAGNDRAQLHKLVSTLFITDSAKQAAIQLIDTDFESGDFAAAAWMGDRLLALHPNLSVERPMMLYRTALAYRLAGNATLAQARADELKKDFAAATGTIRGKDVILADSIIEQLKRAKPLGNSALSNARSESWPMAFGSLDRARVPMVAGFGGAKLFGVDLARETLRIPAAQRETFKQENARARASGLMTGILPVIDRGELFFQDNARVYAVSLDSGLPLPGWAQRYDGDRNGRYAISAWSTPRNTQYTLSLTDDSILAIMGQIDAPSLLAGLNLAQRDTRLVCLDRRDGREKWVVRPAQLAIESLKGVELTGTPLVVGDSVFVTAHSTGGVQFQDCYLLCFDLDGRFKFSSYIASANSGAAIFDGDFANLNQDTPQLAYSSGRVFVLSNLGALSAVDAYDGKVIWLNLYPRQGNNEMARQFGAFRAGWGRANSQADAEKPWDPSPLIVTDGKVFALPGDGTYAIVYDAGTGAELKRIKLAHLGGARSILGVSGDAMVFVGGSGEGAEEQTQIICLNWRNYDAEKYNEKDGAMLLWRANKLSGLRGRGFLTTDAVYIPTQSKLLKINLKTGKTDKQYPEGERTWDESEGAGNILVMQDHLIVAGPERVNVYTDLNLAMAKLDAEVTAAPGDPQMRLRYAGVMFVAGKYELSIAKLDEAIQVIGGLEKPTDPAARDRIYSTAMVFAEKLARDKNDANKELAAGLYDRAAKAADSTQQQVNYRISRARFEMEKKDDAAQLALLQEILADANWRAVPVALADSPGPAQAGSVAEKQIKELMLRSPKAYETIALQATDAFKIAQDAADPGKLLAVAQVYPNSTVAPEALQKAAEAYETVGNPRQSVQILRQLYFKYPAAPNRALVLESLARNYLAIPNHVEVAIARLAQGARIPNAPALTKPLVLPDGSVIQNVSFTEALSKLRKYHEQATARALPDFALPLASNARMAKAFVRNMEPMATQVTSIVAPLREFARNDRLVTFSAGAGLSAYVVGSNQPLFTSNAIVEAPSNCAWMGETLLVWSAGRIVMLKTDGSSSLWEADLRAIPVVEVATRETGDANIEIAGDGEPDGINDELPPINLNNGQVIILQGGQRIIRRGNVNLRLPIARPGVPGAGVPAVVAGGAEQISRVAVVSDRVIVGTTNGRILSLDLTDGKTIWQMRPSDRQPTRLLASDDFVVAEFNDGAQIRVVALDTFTGQSILHRAFPADGTGLINMALAPDGKLVYLLFDKVECKDLFEPGDRLAFSVTVSRDAGGAFIGATQSDQLLITNGRIIAVSDEGRFLRVYSLENGNALHRATPGGGAAGGKVDTDIGLQTMGSEWRTRLWTAGSRVYAVGDKSLVAYNLDKLTDTWHSNSFDDHVTQDAMIGQDYLLTVAEVVSANRPQQGRQFPTSVVINAFSRAVLENGRESGVFDYRFPLNTPTGIQSWQGVDGGMYYLTGDQKLFFLKGARP